jgi:hypothetical protein
MLKFASQEEALQHLSDLTGKKIVIAGDYEEGMKKLIDIQTKIAQKNKERNDIEEQLQNELTEKLKESVLAKKDANELASLVDQYSKKIDRETKSIRQEIFKLADEQKQLSEDYTLTEYPEAEAPLEHQGIG